MRKEGLLIPDHSAGFFDIASNCLFGQCLYCDYGDPYPGNGKCSEAIGNSSKYIDGPIDVRNSLSFDLNATLFDAREHPNFEGVVKFYVLGYPAFFNAATTYCNGRSLAVHFPREKFWLTQELREAINDAVARMNMQISNVVAGMNDERFVFVNITGAFEGHRFCEPDNDWWPFNPDESQVWFWTANVFEVASDNPDDPTQSRINQDWLLAYNNTNETQAAEYATKFDWEGLDEGEDPLNITLGVDQQSGGPDTYHAFAGSVDRSLHPTEPGHTAIKDVLVAQVLQDFPSLQLLAT